MTKPTLIQSIDIPLKVALSVESADGKAAKRDQLTMRRPNLANAKQIALIIGPKFFSAIMAEGAQADSKGDKTADVDMQLVVTEVVAAITTQEGLDGLTQVIASMCDEPAEIIDQLDWLDILQVAKAVLGFFPALQSIDLLKLGQT